jgi:uncharacterized protein with PQ loop repeat
MPTCPHCKNRLPILEAISLNPKQNIIGCKKCGTFLVAHLGSALGLLVTFGFLGVALLKYATSVKSTNSNLSLVFGLLGIGVFIFGLYFFLTKIQLSKYVGEKKSIHSIQSEAENNEKLYEFEQSKNHFKKLYLNKPDQELNTIATQKGWQPEAQKAAMEILEERKNKAL